MYDSLIDGRIPPTKMENSYVHENEKRKKKGYWQSFDYKVTGNLSFKFKLKSTVVELELVCLAF